MIDSSILRIILVISLLSICSAVSAFEPFVVKKIDVQGLQRISVGTVFNYLPIEPGEQISPTDTANAIRALFKTGFFQDVAMERNGDRLSVILVERPSIDALKFEGNDDIETDQLMSNMKSLGFSEGKIFNRSLLDRVVLELKRQYMALGKYGVKVVPEILQLERNRVDILIKVEEGHDSSIQHLNIIGNSAYSDSKLKGLFELSEQPLFALFSSKDQYAREKLSGDLERLRSFYMDSGYINFSIDSTQVAITPDKSGVYVTINISEGEQFRVSEIKISGDTILSTDELRALIPIENGDIFSRSSVIEGSANIGERLGEYGYAFANINPIPQLNNEKREVALNYYVDPGKRVFVRRITVSGNFRTKDEVVRREFRQMESGWISTGKVKRSKVRLDRLGYFQEVSVNTPVVTGSADQVDLRVKLLENKTTGTFNASFGYSSTEALTLGTSVNQKNFMGTGKSFSLNANTSRANTLYSFNLTDPYSTLNGVSRKISISYKRSDASKLESADYTTDAYGATVNFGVPMSEYNTFRYGFNVEHTAINSSTETSAVITDFCHSVASLDECSFNTYKINSSFSRDTRDRFLYPTRGSITSLSATVAVPVDEVALSFYKSRVMYKSYFPLTEKVVLSNRGEISYAGVYNDGILPPYEFYRAGGVGTIRGYSAYSLGATADTFDADGKSIGGDVRLLANVELLFPPPWSDEKSKSMRLALFLDAGNVFNRVNGLELSQLRYSMGAALAWVTPIGPLKFSFGVPVNRRDSDKVESFQFTIGTL